MCPLEGLPYERGGDACREFWIKPPKETNVGVAQLFLAPKRSYEEAILNFDYIKQVNKTN